MSQSYRTVNSEWYKTTCLPVVFQEIKKTNRRRRITLHHDNVSSYTSAETATFLSIEILDLMSHPPFGLIWHRMTFLLFPYVETEMRGQRFSTPDETVNAFRMHVLVIPQSEWQKCFGNWFKRMQKCLDLNGKGFEKQ